MSIIYDYEKGESLIRCLERFKPGDVMEIIVGDPYNHLNEPDSPIQLKAIGNILKVQFVDFVRGNVTEPTKIHWIPVDMQIGKVPLAELFGHNILYIQNYEDNGRYENYECTDYAIVVDENDEHFGRKVCIQDYNLEASGRMYHCNILDDNNSETHYDGPYSAHQLALIDKETEQLNIDNMVNVVTLLSAGVAMEYDVTQMSGSTRWHKVTDVSQIDGKYRYRVKRKSQMEVAEEEKNRHIRHTEEEIKKLQDKLKLLKGE